MFATEELTNVVTSASWDDAPLTPENWLVSPAIDLSSYSGEILIDWSVFAQDPDWVSEKYKIVVSTTDNAVGSFSDENIVFLETIPGADVYERSADLSDYAGETIYIAIVHYDSSDWFRINIDNIVVKAASGGGGEEIFYTATVAVEAGDIEYKYFSDFVGAGWEGGEWEGGANRTATISADVTLDDVWGDQPQDVDTETLNNATNVYPNPASDVLTVSHNSRISGIRVFDVTGRMMYNAEVSNLNTTTVDVSRFNEGVYILQVVTNEGIANKKFVVRK